MPLQCDSLATYPARRRVFACVDAVATRRVAREQLPLQFPASRLDLRATTPRSTLASATSCQRLVAVTPLCGARCGVGGAKACSCSGAKAQSRTRKAHGFRGDRSCGARARNRSVRWHGGRGDRRCSARARNRASSAYGF